MNVKEWHQHRAKTEQLLALQDVTNVQNEPPNAKQNSVRLTLTGAGLDTHIPTIPEVRESDIKAKFKIKILTPIEGRPTYEKWNS